MHVCLHIYIHAYLHGNMHPYTCACPATNIHTFMLHTYICMHVCLHKTCACMYYICIDTDVHDYIYMCVYVCMYINAVLKDFTIIDRESNTLHHQAKEALHICIKGPSFNRNIGKVRIPSVFNKLLKPPTQLELPHSSIPPPKGGTFFTWYFNTKDN